MTEALSACFREAAYLSLSLVLGGPIFLLLSGPHADIEITAWRRRWERLFPWILSIYLLAAAAVLLLQAAATAGRSVSQLLAEGDELAAFVWGTRYGRIGLLKLAVASLMLLPCLMVRCAGSEQGKTRSLIGLLSIAAVTVMIGPLAGHASGDEQTRWLTPLNVAHLFAVCAWLGGLPLWIDIARRIGRNPDTARCAYVARVRMQFSRMAMVCMAVIVVAGALLATGFVETPGDLLGTRYGLLICGKIFLLICALAIANHVRRRFLPEVLAAHVEAGRLYPLAARWVSVELLASVCIVGLASQLSQTTPAAHDLSYWWLPVRISAAATWPIASTQVVVSVAILVLVLEAFWIVRQRHRPTIKRRGLWLYVATATAAAGLALWKLSVPAYPDTYLRSTVPYLTVSIVQGKHHFERYCADCHGAGGLGDGPSAGRLPRPPADLSLPHTALHTVGDMFWWISHGIPESGMPSFAGDLDEQARWDVTNFLRAFSQGFEARLLSPVILADQPWLGAPDFYYEDREGVPQELKNFRELSNVLLVFPSQSAGEALGRLRDLARAQDQLRANKLEVIVVNAKALAEDEGGLVQVGNGAEEIREAYDLLSRNLTNRGSGRSLSLDRKHMEFLIDRFGYIRGRWIPEDEPEGWDKIESLEREVLRLNAEPRLRPPPDDHVH